MKDSNYIVIQGWMVNKLKLSGNELMVYAVIYGFSQDGESRYEGSGQYIADSLGISRRAVFSILDKLVKDGLIIKFERFERNIKLCDYKVSTDFLPKEDKKGGYEESSQGRKNLHREGDEESSHPMKNLHGGGEKTSQGGCEESSHHTSNTYINNTSTSAGQPDSNEEPPPQDEKEAEEASSSVFQNPDNASPLVFSQDELKNALLSVDKTLFLDNFYPQAAAFMSKHALDLKYLDFIYNETAGTNYKSFKSMYYTLFFKDGKAGEYKALSKPSQAPPPPPDDIKCPVCGAVHSKNDEICPNCSLPRNPMPQTISLFMQLLTFPVDRRNEYLKRENVIYSEFKGDFTKIKIMIDTLRNEFNLKPDYEEPSRSYHS